MLKFIGAMLSGLVTMSVAAYLGSKRKKERK
jgi:LPXTG-motif cell wall-anchored protein